MRVARGRAATFAIASAGDDARGGDRDRDAGARGPRRTRGRVRGRQRRRVGRRPPAASGRPAHRTMPRQRSCRSRSPASCRRRRSASSSRRSMPPASAAAEIWGEGGFGVHPGQPARARSRSCARSPRSSSRTASGRPCRRSSERFGCEVTHISGVTALIYDEGDHFAAHSDGGGDDEAPAEIRRRRVSLVLALNDGTSDFAGRRARVLRRRVPRDRAPGTPRSRRCAASPACSSPSRSSMIHRVAPRSPQVAATRSPWALAPHRASAAQRQSA